MPRLRLLLQGPSSRLAYKQSKEHAFVASDPACGWLSWIVQTIRNLKVPNSSEFLRLELPLSTASDGGL